VFHDTPVWSATPQRTDQVGLHAIFERVVHHRTIADMIGQGYLCDLRGLQVELDFDFRRLRTHHGDDSERQLEKVLLATD
jgi:superfamily II DNA or RNA helicase